MDINDDIKKQVSKFLPDALEKAVTSYSDFSETEKIENS